MQFVLNGPDVPEELLQAHEDGDVVFFCGAGVSYPLGLPGFKGLLESVRVELGDNPNTDEKRIIVKERWDAAFEYLEQKIRNKNAIIDAIRKVLTPHNVSRESYDTHRALLTLSRTRRDHPSVHLVTTNFDRAFEHVSEELDWEFEHCVAPRLPIPKDASWNGIVYLHGLINDGKGRSLGDNGLVYSSGGFGRAYLYERWAARFVTELLRNYTVCFVGYSLNDPVMHYLVDAIDADWLEGEKVKPAYIFAGKDIMSNPELSRNETIIKIPYSEDDGHYLLHRTLHSWADSYRRGTAGKEALVDEAANIDPSQGPDTGYKKRLLWAISDKNAIPAKRFAEKVPPPPIGWLDVFEKNGFTEIVKSDDGPTIVLWQMSRQEVDVRCSWIFKWAATYLNHPKLIEKVARYGSALHPAFLRYVEQNLCLLDDLRKAGRENEFAELKLKYPYLVPDLYVEKLWRLALAGKVIPIHDNRLDYFHLLGRVKQGADDILTLSFLRELLAPFISISKSFSSTYLEDGSKELSNEQLFTWDLVQRSQHLSYFIKEICAAQGIYKFLDVAVGALQDGLDAGRYLSPDCERSYIVAWAVPSIEDHRQNHIDLHPWRGVVDVIRNAWIELTSIDRGQAFQYVQNWFASKYFIFKRIALFASKRSDIVEPHFWLERLLANNSALLWDMAAKREVCRLLATTADKLTEEQLVRLVKAIVKGPPPSSPDSEVEDDRVEYKMWLLLDKLDESGCQLPVFARETLDSLVSKYQWKRSPWQQEEFGLWLSGTGDPDFDEQVKKITLPREVKSLTKAVINGTGRDYYSLPRVEDDWDEICDKDPELASSALIRAADQGNWNIQFWHDALCSWRKEEKLRIAICLLENSLPKMGDAIYGELCGCIADWAETGAKTRIIPEELLSEIARRIFDNQSGKSKYGGGEKDDGAYVSRAINHPVGKVVFALLDNGFPETIHKGDGIKRKYRDLYTQVCERRTPWMRHGRVVLASRLIALYYADEDWVKRHLLPYARWETDEKEAAAFWTGFLYANSVIHASLMNCLREEFMSMVRYLNCLKVELVQRYCSFLTAMGVMRIDGFSYEYFRDIFQLFTQNELKYAAKAIKDILQSRSDKDSSDARRSPELCWTEEIWPFIHNVWPKDAALVTEEISESFAETIISAGDKLPDAFAKLKGMLRHIEDNSFFLHKIHTAGCAKKFPIETLELIYVTIKRTQWGVDNLRACLDDIKSAKLSLGESEMFQALVEVAKRRETGSEM